MVTSYRTTVSFFLTVWPWPFYLLIFGSTHTERLLYSTRVPSLVLIAQAVFLLECGQTDTQTDKQTDVTERPTHAGGCAGVCNNWHWMHWYSNCVGLVDNRVDARDWRTERRDSVDSIGGEHHTQLYFTTNVVAKKTLNIHN